MTLSTTLSSFVMQLLNLLSLATWLSIDQAKILLIAFFFYLCFVLICTKIYSSFFRKQTVCKRTIIFEYNRLWSQIAASRHEKNDLWNDFFFQQAAMLSSKWTNVYFSSRQTVSEYLLSIEKKLWIIISQQNKDLFVSLYRKYTAYHTLSSIFLLTVTVLTLWVIRLFIR